ncbi:MAG: hypothetical protein RLZZ267_260 [Bacillota bacterium]
MGNKQQKVNGIPNVLIKANQALIALTVLISLITDPRLLIVVFFIQLISYKYGMDYNLFIRLTAPIWRSRVNLKDVQAFELAKFNATIAVALLFVATLSAVLGWNLGAYIFGGMVAAAATAAVLGYCIGCTIYFQYKQFKARRAS